MRSQVSFVMHSADETEFVRHAAAEPGVVLVDGPNWSTPRPPIVTELCSAGNYLIIWNPQETPPLKGKRYRNEKKTWWCCENEFRAIQFLRSGFWQDGKFLLEGRIAVATTDLDGTFNEEATAHLVERRYGALRKFIRKSYSNGVILWQVTSAPRSNTNPLKPAKDLWIGPHALQWLRDDPRNRWVPQFVRGRAKGYLLDLVEDSKGGAEFTEGA